jgi:hypothetical protein
MNIHDTGNLFWIPSLQLGNEDTRPAIVFRRPPEDIGGDSSLHVIAGVAWFTSEELARDYVDRYSPPDYEGPIHIKQLGLDMPMSTYIAELFPFFGHALMQAGAARSESEATQAIFNQLPVWIDPSNPTTPADPDLRSISGSLDPRDMPKHAKAMFILTWDNTECAHYKEHTIVISRNRFSDNWCYMQIQGHYDDWEAVRATFRERKEKGINGPFVLTMDTGLECRDQAFDWAKKSVDEWEVNQRETESAVRRIDLTDR